MAQKEDSPRKTTTLKEFSGMNTQDLRFGVEDNEFVWLENIMRVGDGKLHSVPGPTDVLAIFGSRIIMGQITPRVGALSLTGYAPTVSSPNSKTPSTGSLALVGRNPMTTTNNSPSIMPGRGTLAATGQAATGNLSGFSITPGTGGIGVTGETSNVVRDLTVSYISDDFQIGQTGSNAIGELRWVNVNTTSLVLTSEASHPGIYRFSSAVSGGITLKNSQIDELLFSETFDLVFVHRANGTLANSTNRLGLFVSSAAPTNNPPTDGIYFERLSTDANWFGVVRAASAQTRIDTGIAATTSFTKLRMRRVNGTTIGFTVDANAEVTTTATEPTGAAFVTMQMFPATGTQTADIDYFDLLITGLSR